MAHLKTKQISKAAAQRYAHLSHIWIRPPIPSIKCTSPSPNTPTSSTREREREREREMGEDQKRSKVKKGMLAVCIGLEGKEEEERFVIPIPHLHHPLFKALLDASSEVYGYPSSGPLRLHCSIQDFINIRGLIENESPHRHSRSNHGSSHQVHHHPLSSMAV